MMRGLLLKLLPFLPLLIAGIVSLVLWHFLPVLIGVLLSFLLFFWYFFLKSFFKLRSRLSVEIREKIIPDVWKASSSITTLSSAAILLTFSIIRILGGDISYKRILIFSWYGFGFCIAIGVTIGILTYIYRTNYLIMINTFLDFDQEKRMEEKEKKGKVAQSLLDGVKRVQIALFSLAFLQPLIFFGSIVLVIIFATKNI